VQALKNIFEDLDLRNNVAEELLTRNAAIDVLTELARDLEQHSQRSTHKQAFGVFVWTIDTLFDIPSRLESGDIAHFYVLLTIKTLCKTMVSTSDEVTVARCVELLGKTVHNGRDSPHFKGESGVRAWSLRLRALCTLSSMWP